MLCIIGGLVIWRTYTESKKEQASVVRPANSSFFAHTLLLYKFGAIMMCSGITCFLLRRNWFIHLSYLFKVPFFALLGISFAFIILFLFADCLNYCSISCPRSQGRMIIEGPCQIYLLASVAIILGCLYGLIFGLLDVEDAAMFKLAVLSYKQEKYCYPIGIILGFVTGLLNQAIREHGGERITTSDTWKFQQEI